MATIESIMTVAQRRIAIVRQLPQAEDPLLVDRLDRLAHDTNPESPLLTDPQATTAMLELNDLVSGLRKEGHVSPNPNYAQPLLAWQGLRLESLNEFSAKIKGHGDPIQQAMRAIKSGSVSCTPRTEPLPEEKRAEILASVPNENGTRALRTLLTPHIETSHYDGLFWLLGEYYDPGFIQKMRDAGHNMADVALIVGGEQLIAGPQTSGIANTQALSRNLYQLTATAKNDLLKNPIQATNNPLDMMEMRKIAKAAIVVKPDKASSIKEVMDIADGGIAQLRGALHLIKVPQAMLSVLGVVIDDTSESHLKGVATFLPGPIPNRLVVATISGEKTAPILTLNPNNPTVMQLGNKRKERSMPDTVISDRQQQKQKELQQHHWLRARHHLFQSNKAATVRVVKVVRCM